jgi:hypothetical protein
MKFGTKAENKRSDPLYVCGSAVTNLATEQNFDVISDKCKANSTFTKVKEIKNYDNRNIGLQIYTIGKIASLFLLGNPF